MKKGILIIIAIVLIAAVFGCRKKENPEKTKSLEAIYRENGIPVKVKEMKPEMFRTELTYNAAVSGYKQSFASAFQGGRIEKVNVKIGDFVKKDSVIIEFPLDAPGAHFQQAKAAYELAEKTYKRMQSLYEVGGISKQNLEQTETQFKVNKANWDAAQQLLKVRAPIDGYVTSLAVNETDNVKERTVLATISQTDKLKAKIWANEEEISQIKQEMKASATWQHKTIYGKVTEIDEAMNPVHNAFGVNLLFENPKYKIKTGVIVEISIVTYENPRALLIARKNIRTDKNGNYVFVVEDNSARKRYLQTGKENDEIEITDGLKNGDKVIVQGLNLVSDGAKVKEVR